MWFGTWLAGAVRWTVGQASRLSNPLDLRSGGTPDLRSVTQFTTADGLADNRVFVFHEDADGALWIGTHNGLNRFKDGRFFTFRTEHGLFDSLINWLEEDDFGRLWFTCNRGIFRISRRELNEVAEGKKSRANVAVYGTADGMISPETNGEHQPAGCKTRDGRLWFPTSQGVVVITPQSLADTEATEVAAPVIIEQVVADGEVIYGDDQSSKNTKSQIENPQLKLAPGRARVLRIRYTANSFGDPRRVRFRYRLAGQDHDWRDATDERVAYYTDLNPGKYRFEVKAANPQGVWSGSVGAFAFSLAAHFWQTLPFYVVSAVGMIVLAVWLAAAVDNYRLRWQRQLLKSEERQALADERTRIARDLHDDLGTALTGLALELDVIRRETLGAPPAQERLGATAKRTRNLAERMREVVWAVNPRCDNVLSLASYLERRKPPISCVQMGFAGGSSFPMTFPLYRWIPRHGINWH